ncbi:ArsR/SmtB family transcription factor [Novipirellula artificiosorum]|uniref:Cadmium resistance transcriptional regulatory protein CadC n=1 Tax=Novipirellula artificiosorum TaxID=2528016 RepID=A0A5C6DTU1_9BACT|nr:metalloregulator ArsR/SmtB family transcription factor [Novipirellula artificiosorum]TWU38456.1 Cadmium resistance transcriptional regulatory protein CadC [Novipirellula artificiosorum]
MNSEPAILSDDQMHRIAKAIADPQRFAILVCIAQEQEIACKSLVEEFSITQATISHHLKELVAAGLIRSRRQGQLAILSCRRDVCERFTEVLSEMLVAPGAVENDQADSAKTANG